MGEMVSRTGKTVKTVMCWKHWSDGQKWIDRVMNLKPDEPWSKFPSSSVERGMASATVEEAIKLVEPENGEEIREKFKKHLKMSPYTNWSGD
ncbi:hypothetical protein [Candidatus Darwinibacter acetoxidans]